jgi:dTDP-4-amino-4,6-dideoxygalactose transaminase
MEKGLKARLERVMSSAGFIMGAEVQELEERLAEYVGVKHCVSCANGTDAIILPLLAWGVGHGDLVFVPSFTFFATAEAVSLLGATVVFVDSEPDAYNMDLRKLEQAFERASSVGGARPKAVISVDLFGQPAANPEIEKFAQKNGLLFLEDAAQGFGGLVGGRKACSFGDAASTSFFPAKPLGCYGDGGAMFTNDYGLAEVLRSMRAHGQGWEKYHNVRLGFNSRLDAMQAAVLLEKLRFFDDETRRKNEIAALYEECLAGALTTPAVKPDRRSSWAQYSVLARDSQERQRIMAHLGRQGIPTAIYYKTPLHKQPVYQEETDGKGASPPRDAAPSPAFGPSTQWLRGGTRPPCLRLTALPVSEDLSERVFSLPMHAYLSDEDARHVAEAVLEALD